MDQSGLRNYFILHAHPPFRVRKVGADWLKTNSSDERDRCRLVMMILIIYADWMKIDIVCLYKRWQLTHLIMGIDNNNFCTNIDTTKTFVNQAHRRIETKIGPSQSPQAVFQFPTGGSTTQEIFDG